MAADRLAPWNCRIPPPSRGEVQNEHGRVRCGHEGWRRCSNGGCARHSVEVSGVVRPTALLHREVLLPPDGAVEVSVRPSPANRLI